LARTLEAKGKRLVAATPRPLRPMVLGVARRGRDVGDWLRGWLRFGAASHFVRSSNFARELKAVSSGTADFRRTSGGRGSTDYVLRRNTHRLEKGIISRPRRDVFATDYIEETVAHFVVATSQLVGSIEDGSELAWSRDVLNEYFVIAGSSPEIDRARQKYLASPARLCGETRNPLIPFVRDLSKEPPVEYDALLGLAQRRRSVRWFLDRPVPRELIDAAVAVAAQAPSACNRQPFEFYVYDTPELVRRVGSVPGGAAGFVENFPAIVAVVGKLNAFYSDRDRHLIYIDGSLAAMSFMLALESLGLSSCPINTPGVEDMEQRLSDELSLASYERPVMLIALGYADPTGLVPRSQKKPISDLRRYNP
jgi:nitroreductase